jgi:hypothetical protein
MQSNEYLVLSLLMHHDFVSEDLKAEGMFTREKSGFESCMIPETPLSTASLVQGDKRAES